MSQVVLATEAEDQDERFSCPRCGSLYMTSSKHSSRCVFQVKSILPPEVILLQESLEGEIIEPLHVYCGACSWSGGIEELVMGWNA